MTDQSGAGPDGHEEFPSFDGVPISQRSTNHQDTTTSTGTDTGIARRGRRRTTTLIGAENPAENPLTPSDASLSNLVNRINAANRRASQSQESARRRLSSAPAYTPPTYNPPTYNPPTYSAPSPAPFYGGSEDHSTTPVQEEEEEDDETTPKAESPRDTSVARLDTSGDTTPIRGSPTSSDSASDSSVTSAVNNVDATSDPLVASPPSTTETSDAASDPLVASTTSQSSDGQSDLPTTSATEQSQGTADPVATLPPSENASDPVVDPSTTENNGALDTAVPAETAQRPIPAHLSGSLDHITNPQVYIGDIPDFSSAALRGIWAAQLAIMQGQGYQNYLESPGVGPNPRQAPPSPSMHQNGGMNGGGMGMAGGMVGFPTPAGHQSDLNYIMQMVEELSAQLAQNQGLTAGIVEKMGKVRAKAQNLDLSNDELVTLAASELNISSDNIEKENSELRKALDKALFEKKENWKLAVHGANILSDILDKMHTFKSQHEADTLIWHKNYRKQLADEREENLRLRNQIDDMKAAACRANEYLRQMRRYVTDHDELNELRIENISLRQQRRLWKRKALPLIPDDDSEWSDDDDIIDPEEKKRRAAEEAEKERKDKEGGEGETGAAA